MDACLKQENYSESRPCHLKETKQVRTIAHLRRLACTESPPVRAGLRGIDYTQRFLSATHRLTQERMLPRRSGIASLTRGRVGSEFFPRLRPRRATIQ